VSAPGTAASASDASPLTEPVFLSDVRAFDPQGDDGSERDDFLGNVIDGAPSTVWATERYKTPAFGNLKDGVGFHVDLGGPRVLTQVTLDVPRGGFDVEIRVAGRIEQDPSSWTTVTAIPQIESGPTTYALSEVPQGRYLLVWITGGLQPFEGGYHAEIGEVRVQALAS
jgi:hypothetical protein